MRWIAPASIYIAEVFPRTVRNHRAGIAAKQWSHCLLDDRAIRFIETLSGKLQLIDADKLGIQDLSTDVGEYFCGLLRNAVCWTRL